MQKTPNVFDRMRQGEIVLGSVITINDPIVTEALCSAYDFLWIDTEHNPMPLDVVQGHLLAAKGTGVTMLVRVAWNDPVLIKPVLDIGAHGVIVPMVSTVEDTRRAVAACRYPPDGIRGYGPRRPSNYGRLGGPDFCKAANDAMITVVQIELADAVKNIDGIVGVAGLRGRPDRLERPVGLDGPYGPAAASRSARGDPEGDRGRPQKANMPVGIAIGDDVAMLQDWIDKGIQWVTGGGDTSLMLRSADQITTSAPGRIFAPAPKPEG